MDNQERIPLMFSTTIIKGRQQSNQESAPNRKDCSGERAQVNSSNVDFCSVVRTSARHMGHPARARDLLQQHFLFFEKIKYVYEFFGDKNFFRALFLIKSSSRGTYKPTYFNKSHCRKMMVVKMICNRVVKICQRNAEPSTTRYHSSM